MDNAQINAIRHLVDAMIAEGYALTIDDCAGDTLATDADHAVTLLVDALDRVGNLAYIRCSGKYVRIDRCEDALAFFSPSYSLSMITTNADHAQYRIAR